MQPSKKMYEIEQIKVIFCVKIHTRALPGLAVAYCGCSFYAGTKDARRRVAYILASVDHLWGPSGG
jgi:hypothetical protein